MDDVPLLGGEDAGVNAYVELRRAWSTYDYFADKSRTERASFVLSLLLALGFFTATAAGTAAGGAWEGGASATAVAE